MRTVYARLPTALAEWQSGWESFLQFALEIEAIDRAEEREIERRSWWALEELGVVQAKYPDASDPTLRFVALLQAALQVPIWRIEREDDGRAHPVRMAIASGMGGGGHPRANRKGWGNEVFQSAPT